MVVDFITNMGSNPDRNNIVYCTRENMEQKYKIIKVTKEFCFQQIKEAEETLKELRERCDHPEEYIEIVNYMWAPGHIDPDTKMCGICGDVIRETNQYEVKQK